MFKDSRFKINDDLVNREEDKALFSLSKMEIYKFNDEGYTILNFLINKIVSYTELKQYYSSFDDLDQDCFEEFLQTMLENEIIEVA